jgi:hypothetical protein
MLSLYKVTMMELHENSDFHELIVILLDTLSWLISQFSSLFGFYFRSRSFPRAICGSSMPQPQGSVNMYSVKAQCFQSCELFIYTNELSW